jgi:molybdopterin molybdotransferase
LMVKPLLYRMMGNVYKPLNLRLPIGAGYSRSKADRASWAPVSLNDRGEVLPADYHGSAHIHSLAGAMGIMGMAAGVFSYNKGDIVDVRQI